ncbi:MAG TPA: hypothetical protein VMQ76_12620 [Terracidiphilus sp.]|nr:hypothetical protein [Terracidiphilus sp.]
MTYTQSMNCAQQYAEAEGFDYWLHCHSDAVFSPEDVVAVQDIARGGVLGEQGLVKWHMIATCYDVLCAYNTAAIKELGGWNQMFLNYFSDNDLHRRAKLAGYEIVQAPFHNVVHGVDGDGSQTINSDPHLRRQNEILFPAYAHLYETIWGGGPGEEKFNTPWNQ